MGGISRRGFLAFLGAQTALALGISEEAKAKRLPKAPKDPYGCLVDLTLCIGCRKCELACQQVNKLPELSPPVDDPLAFEKIRRTSEKAYTVVNRYHTGKRDDLGMLVPTYVKTQCMHCQDPACVSACIVGALTKHENGTVRYDVTKCIGCRYCMIACPFQIPKYEYQNPIFPEVRKCTFCFERISKGKKPGCVDICPVEALSFGKRSYLLDLAKKRIKENPGRYIDHVYGEHEVGGTSWLYISGVPFEKLEFLKLPSEPIPHLTETIQHGIFSYLWAPLALFGTLGGIMFGLSRRQERNLQKNKGASHEERT